MIQLRRAGFFRELRHGYPDGPSLKDCASNEPLADEVEIAEYLKASPTLYTTPGKVRDVLAPEIIIGPPHIRTDGVWVWPSDLIYYLRTYHCALPSEFVTHIRDQGYRAPQKEQLDFANMEL